MEQNADRQSQVILDLMGTGVVSPHPLGIEIQRRAKTESARHTHIESSAKHCEPARERLGNLRSALRENRLYNPVAACAAGTAAWDGMNRATAVEAYPSRCTKCLIRFVCLIWFVGPRWFSCLPWRL